MLGYYVASLLSDSNAVKLVSAFLILAFSFFGLFFGFDRMLKGKVNVEITSVTGE